MTTKKVKLILVGVFIIASCGDSTPTDESNNDVEKSNAKSDDHDDQARGLSFSSAKEAASKYESIMQDYAKSLADGNEKMAEEYLKKTEDIQEYVDQNFSNQKQLIENMGEMNNQMLEMQKDYMDGTFEIYDDMLNGLGDLPGANGANEANEAMKDAQNEVNDAMKDAQKEMDDAMRDAQQQMDDAMKQYDGQY